MTNDSTDQLTKQNIEEIVEKDPGNIAYLDLANSYYQKGDMGAAMNIFSRGFRKNNSFTDGALGYLKFLADQRDMQEARHVYGRAIIHRPLSPELRLAWANVLVNCQAYEQAERLLKEARDLAPFMPPYDQLSEQIEVRLPTPKKKKRTAPLPVLATDPVQNIPERHKRTVELDKISTDSLDIEVFNMPKAEPFVDSRPQLLLKRKEKKASNSILWVAIVLGFIVLIGAGFYIWKSSHDNESQSDALVKANVSTKENKKNNQKIKDPTELDNYVQLKNKDLKEKKKQNNSKIAQQKRAGQNVENIKDKRVVKETPKENLKKDQNAQKQIDRTKKTKVDNLTPNSPLEKSFAKAIKYSKAGKIDRAQKKALRLLYRFSRIRYPKKQMMLYVTEFGKEMIRHNRIARAKDFLHVVCKKKKAPAEAFYALGIVYEKRREPARALWSYKKATQKDPDDLKSHIALAKIYLKKRKWHYNAKKTLKTIIRKSDDQKIKSWAKSRLKKL